MTSSLTRIIRSLVRAKWPNEEILRLFTYTTISLTQAELATRIARQRRRVARQTGAIA